QICVAWLLVQAPRIDEVRADLTGGQVFTKGVAARMAKRELVEDALPVVRLGGKPRIHQSDSGQVAPGNLTPPRGPCGQVREFHVEGGALEAIHAEVETDEIVVIPAERTVHPQGPGLFEDISPA